MYLDETGSRVPKGNIDPSRTGRDWFALGGYLIKKEDEATAKQLHANFVKAWGITKTLHLTDMRSKTKDFAWLGNLSESEHKQFWSEYYKFLSDVPAIGHACVIDRPGYLARGYVETHGDRAWSLCRSAFDIVVERAVKIACLNDRKLAVAFEAADRRSDERTRRYHLNLKMNGLQFNQSNSSQYAPLDKNIFAENLSTIESKPKQSVMMQIADSYVYALARSAYYPPFDLFNHLKIRRRIADTVLSATHIPLLGVKYYCFPRRENNKTEGDALGLEAAPIR